MIYAGLYSGAGAAKAVLLCFGNVGAYVAAQMVHLCNAGMAANNLDSDPYQKNMFWSVSGK